MVQTWTFPKVQIFFSFTNFFFFFVREGPRLQSAPPYRQGLGAPRLPSPTNRGFYPRKGLHKRARLTLRVSPFLKGVLYGERRHDRFRSLCLLLIRLQMVCLPSRLSMICIQEERQSVNVATTKEADDCTFLQGCKRTLELVASKVFEAEFIKGPALP